MTPALQALQERYPQIVIAVPDVLYSLYKEQNIFSRYISMEKVDTYCKTNQSQVLNLSFPLIPGLEIPKGHFKLNGRYFTKPQHGFIPTSKRCASIFQSYL